MEDYARLEEKVLTAFCGTSAGLNAFSKAFSAPMTRENAEALIATFRKHFPNLSFSLEAQSKEYLKHLKLPPVSVSMQIRDNDQKHLRRGKNGRTWPKAKGSY